MLQPLTINKKLDASSLLLMEAATDGTMLHMRCDFLSSASDLTSLYYKVVLEEVFVTVLSQSAVPGELPTEIVSFAYGKIEVITFLSDKNGENVQKGLLISKRTRLASFEGLRVSNKIYWQSDAKVDGLRTVNVVEDV